MPRIPSYTPKVEANGPVDSRRVTGEDLGFGAGFSALGKGLGELGDAVSKTAERSETADITAKLATLHGQAATDLQQRFQSADPGDQTVAPKFMEDFTGQLDKLGENLQTGAARRYFQETGARLTAHYQQSAFANQADLAGVKAKEDHVRTLNGLSAGLEGDPSSFELSRNMHENYINNLVQTGGLPSEAAEKLRVQGETELAKSAVRGWAQIDPAEAKKQLDSGQWDQYLGGDVKHQMLSEVHVAENARRVQQDRLDAKAKELLDAQREITEGKLLQKYVDGSLTDHDIMTSNLPNFGLGSKYQFVEMGKRALKAKEKTDTHVFNTTYERIIAPDGDPQKIVDPSDLNELVGNGLTARDASWLRGQMISTRTPEGKIESEMKKSVDSVAKASLTSTDMMSGKHDPIGEEQLAKFRNWFNDEYKNQRKAGKTSQELLDPGSPNYLGKGIQRFARTPEQVMKDQLKASQSQGGFVSIPDQPPSATPPETSVPPAKAPHGDTVKQGTKTYDWDGAKYVERRR